MNLHKMPSFFNSRFVTSRQRLCPIDVVGEIGDGEIAQQLGVDYNALPPVGNAEGHHFSPFPWMKEEYCQIKDPVVSPWKCGAQLATPQSGWALKYQAQKRKQFVVVVVLSFTITSCASNARIVNETERGGTVLYSYVEEQDVLHSSGRSDALRLLEEKCPTGYTISREGRVPLIDKAVDRAWMGQVSRDGVASREKRWGIQFECK
jgi:hypothetical protein